MTPITNKATNSPFLNKLIFIIGLPPVCSILLSYLYNKKVNTINTAKPNNINGFVHPRVVPKLNDNTNADNATTNNIIPTVSILTSVLASVLGSPMKIKMIPIMTVALMIIIPKPVCPISLKIPENKLANNVPADTLLLQ